MFLLSLEPIVSGRLESYSLSVYRLHVFALAESVLSCNLLS